MAWIVPDSDRLRGRLAFAGPGERVVLLQGAVPWQALPPFHGRIEIEKKIARHASGAVAIREGATFTFSYAEHIITADHVAIFCDLSVATIVKADDQSLLRVAAAADSLASDLEGSLLRSLIKKMRTVAYDDILSNSAEIEEELRSKLSEPGTGAPPYFVRDVTILSTRPKDPSVVPRDKLQRERRRAADEQDWFIESLQRKLNIGKIEKEHEQDIRRLISATSIDIEKDWKQQRLDFFRGMAEVRHKHGLAALSQDTLEELWRLALQTRSGRSPPAEMSMSASLPHALGGIDHPELDAFMRPQIEGPPTASPEVAAADESNRIDEIKDQ